MVSKQRVDAEMWVEYEEDIISCQTDEFRSVAIMRMPDPSMALFGPISSGADGVIKGRQIAPGLHLKEFDAED